MRDLDKQPYSFDERRVAQFLFDLGVGGGDDPIGFILVSHATLAAERNAANEAAGELQQSFDLRWNADMRAIKRWQAAHPGKENIWPDHADLVVWLLGELEK